MEAPGKGRKMKKELVELELDAIITGSRLRVDNGDLSLLEKSIVKVGVLHPIVVDRSNALISGARRLEACRNAGLATIPAVRLDIDFEDMTALVIQSDENLCRLPLSDEELENLIQMKKSLMSGKLRKGGGLWAKLKNLFRLK
jgi:ParB/RepB/Spo0J family partition protein